MSKIILSIATFISCVLPLQMVIADQSFSMDEITQSLQADYQHQLKKSNKKAKRVHAKQKKIIKRPIKRQPTKLRLPRPQAVRQPVIPARRAPIPNAESLFSAATNGNVQLIGRLLQQGANINASNRERETALHMAAARGQYSAVIYLVSHGANLHARTIKNWQAIHHATRFRHANIANYLKQRGASPYARTSDGLSAIDMARAAGDRRLLGVFGVR